MISSKKKEKKEKDTAFEEMRRLISNGVSIVSAAQQVTTGTNINHETIRRKYFYKKSDKTNLIEPKS